MNRLLIEQSSVDMWRLARRECTDTGFSRTDFNVELEGITSLGKAKMAHRNCSRPKIDSWTPWTTKGHISGAG